MGAKMGITTWAPDSGKHVGLSLTLGGAEVRPLDMAQVYATLANNGLKIPLVAITARRRWRRHVLVDYKVPQGEQVLDPRAAYMISHILPDPTAKLFTYGRNTPLCNVKVRCASASVDQRFEDGHDRQLSRHLDRRLHARSGHGRLGRQHGRAADEAER